MIFPNHLRLIAFDLVEESFQVESSCRLWIYKIDQQRPFLLQKREFSPERYYERHPRDVLILRDVPSPQGHDVFSQPLRIEEVKSQPSKSFRVKKDRTLLSKTRNKQGVRLYGKYIFLDFVRQIRDDFVKRRKSGVLTFQNYFQGILFLVFSHYRIKCCGKEECFG